jgi:hypothetical protein
MPNRLSILLGIILVLSPSIADAKKKKAKAGKPAAAQVQAPVPVPKPKPIAPPEQPVESPAPADDDASFAFGEEPLGGAPGTIRMLLQVRHSSTFADKGRLSPNPMVADEQRGTLRANDGYDIQRAFLRYAASPAKNVNAKFLIDFAELFHKNTKQSFKLAYVEVRATRRLQVDLGLLKRTYSLLELLPIAKHELADVGATDDFIKSQGYAGRDVGAVIRYQPLPTRRMMTISLGAFRGDIDEGFDASPLKAVSARVETHPVKHLRLGANAVWRPYESVKMTNQTEDVTATGTGTTTTTTTYNRTVTMKKGAAAGTDATLTYRHLEIRGELLLGKRTDPIENQSLADRLAGKQGSFWAAWVVVAPKIEIGKWLLVPAAKAEILDTDAMNSNGQRRSIVGVLGVIPMNGVRIIADVTRTWTDPSLRAFDKVPWTSSPKIYVTEPSWTRATLQAQVIF